MLFVIIYEEPRGHEGEYVRRSAVVGRAEHVRAAFTSRGHNIVTDARTIIFVDSRAARKCAAF